MATPAAGEAPMQLGTFRRLAREALPYAPDMVVEKWRSTATGLTVLWSQFENPLVNAYITLATEIFTDSGVPHTLEHLVFLGSKQYPYKGVLDSLANRAFAQGTNAWTANDHTAYTLTTAGSDGFLRMLPVYCDHVFFPTLTDAGFVTEVYHINGKLEDAGVVYSEMQGRENSSADLMELKTQRMLYPRTSAYRSETGGLMSALRVLTIDEIRDYHARYYAPHNAAIVLCGPLDRTELFSALQSIDDRFVQMGTAKGELGPPGWKRPFVETASAMPPVIDGTELAGAGVDDADPPANRDRRRVFVNFPERDESIGEVQISWLGPTMDDSLELQALDVLSTYLTDSPVSPMQQEFVERDEPLCTDIYIGNNERAGRTVLSASFSAVPTAQLDELDGHLDRLLRRIVSQGIDMARMRTVLRRERERLLSQLEMRPADCFSDVLIHDFLYGRQDGSGLADSLDDMRRFDALDDYSSEAWTSLLTRYLIENARLVVVGRPSAALVQQLKDETQARVAQRRQAWGEQGAQACEQKLQLARQENDAPIPPNMLQSFRIPSSDTIAWIKLATAESGCRAAGECHEPLCDVATADDKTLQAHVDADAPAPPFSIQFDHISSKFVLVSVVMGTQSVPDDLRAYLTLYLSMVFSLPVQRQDGSSLKYEDVVKQLDEDVLEYDATIGIGSSFSETMAIEFKAPVAHYEKVVAWVYDLLWRSEFSLDRVRVAAAKLAQSLPEQKRDGRMVASALSRSMLFDNSTSTCEANTILRQAQRVPEMVDALQEEPERVLEHFNTVRNALLRPEHVRISVAGDIRSIARPLEPWRAYMPRALADASPSLVLRPLPWARDICTGLGRKPALEGRMCALPAIESSYAVFTSRGLRGYTDKDYAPLVITLTILNAMESFLWRYIRGAGLAYGASIRNDAEAEQIHFLLYRAPNAAKAFLEGRKVVQALAYGTALDDGSHVALDETMLESAKSSLHFSIADAEGTVGAAALESFVDVRLKRVGRGRGKRLLQQASSVTLDDVQRCMKQYIVPLFDASTSVCAVACSLSTAASIRSQLQAHGYVMHDVDMPAGGSDESGTESSESGSGSDSDVSSESAA